MDVQKALVTRVLDKGDLRPLKLYNLAVEDFTDEDAQLVLGFILDQWSQTHTVPSRELARAAVPSFDFVESNDDVATLCFHVANELASAKYGQILLEASDSLDTLGAIEAAERMATQFRDLSTSFGKVKTYVAGDNADQEYEALTSDKEMGRVVPVPWGPMQAELGGLRGNEMLLFYGRPKQGKTWMLVEASAFLTEQGYRVLFLSPEMSRDQILRRTYAVRCKFPYRDMRLKHLFRGNTKDALKNRLRLSEVIREYKETKRLVIQTLQDEDDEFSISFIEGLVEEHRPDVLIFDQVHYGVTEKKFRDDWAQLGAVTRGLRRISRMYDIPIIASTQANRKSVKKARTSDDTDDVAGSDKIVQLVDIAGRIRLHKELGIRTCHINAARECELEGWTSKADFCANMGIIPDDHYLVHKLKEMEEKKIPRAGAKAKIGRPRATPPKALAPRTKIGG